jgi:hypothetical protein
LSFIIDSVFLLYGLEISTIDSMSSFLTSLFPVSTS